jgi:hypothetical protein
LAESFHHAVLLRNILYVWRRMKIAQEIYNADKSQLKKSKAHAKSPSRKETAKKIFGVFLCETLASSRLCVKVFAFSVKRPLFRNYCTFSNRFCRICTRLMYWFMRRLGVNSISPRRAEKFWVEANA